MDQTLKEKMEKVGKWSKESKDEDESMKVEMSFEQKMDGDHVLISGPRGKQEHSLKPLEALYVPERERRSSIPGVNEQEHMGLMMAIEGAISRYYQDHPALTDREVIHALESFGQKPEIAYDLLTNCIQLNLRFQLSVEDYSRSEVRWALRKVLASVRRHHRIDGVRGYLDFIIDYV